MVIAVVGLILAAAVLFMRPKDYSNQNSDADRQLGIAAIAQGLHDYKNKNGTWPPGLPAKDVVIGNVQNGFDLCHYLVPDFLKGIPLDPALGTQYVGDDTSPTATSDPCNQDGVKYFSGYVVRQDANGKVTVSAGSVAQAKLEITIE